MNIQNKMLFSHFRPEPVKVSGHFAVAVLMETYFIIVIINISTLIKVLSRTVGCGLSAQVC